jgi:hypothetical protein
MRLFSVSVTILLVLLSSAALAQQSPGQTGDTIDRPLAPATPEVSEPASKGYTGAYGSPGPATPYFSGPLPAIDTGPGRSIAEPDGSTKTVKAVPCGRAARETDGFTTCVGIPDADAKGKKSR